MSVDTEERAVFLEIPLSAMEAHEKLARAVMPLVRDACKHTRGRFTVLAVADALKAGSMRLWGVLHGDNEISSIVVTRVNTDDIRGRVFEILVVGPNDYGIWQYLPVLRNAAAQAQCVKMRLTGPGFWEKRLGTGWHRAAVVYEKDVADK